MPAVALALGALIVAFPFIRYWGAVAGTRLLEDYPVGWLEPIFYTGALRVYDGLPIYGPPALDYIAPIYGPGMSLAGGLLFTAFGPGYMILRVFSVACLAGLVAVMAAWVRRESGSWLWAWVPGFLLLVLDKPMNYWFQHANVDIPYLFLVILALYLVHSMKWSRGGMIAAGCCMALAALFKQNALLMALAVGIYVLLNDRRAFLFYAGAMAAILLPLAVVLHVTSGGWFWTITGRIPIDSLVKSNVDFRGTIKDLSTAALAGFVVSTALLVALDRDRRGLFWFLVGGAALAVSYRTFCKDGGGENCMLPVLILAVIAPLQLLETLKMRLKGRLPATLVNNLAASVLFVVVFWSVPDGSLDTPPRKDVNFPKFAAFESNVRDTVQGTAGPVFIGARPEILYQTGRAPTFHQSALYEGTFRTSVYDLKKFLKGPLAAHRWKKMVVWEYDDKALMKLISTYYRKETELGGDPLIGVKVAVWVPKPEIR